MIYFLCTIFFAIYLLYIIEDSIIFHYLATLPSVYVTSIRLYEKSVFPFQSGTTNPTVKLFCIDLDMVVQGNVTLVEIEHPPELSTSERILSAVDFPTDSLVYATWMNRVQNRAYFQLCDVDSLVPNCTTVGISSFSREKDNLLNRIRRRRRGKERRDSFDSTLYGDSTFSLSLYSSFSFFEFPRILI